MEIGISAARLRRGLIILVIVFIGLSLAGALNELYVHARLGGLVRMLDADAERSVPAWYSSLALALSAALLAAIYATLRKRGESADLLAWGSLAALFAFLSLDEAVGVHETVGKHLRHAFDLKGALYFGWVVPALVAVPLIAAAYLRFLARLPARRRNQFIAAGIVFVGGALGLELIGGGLYPVVEGAPLTPAYVLCSHLEELLEMLGIIFFNAALVEHLAELLGPGGLRLRFTRD